MGRMLTSVVAVAALRAQGGVAPQVVSHVLGLKRAVEDGSWKEDVELESEESAEWLASDEGGIWLLNAVDSIVQVVGGSTFGTRESKI